MTKQEIENNWNNTAPNLSDENLLWIFNNAQQITKSEQKVLQEVVLQVVLKEIVKRKIQLKIK